MAELRLRLRSIQLLAAIDSYINRYDVHGDDLKRAASDVLDGAVFNHEIEELIRRRLLTVIVDRPPRLRDDECGDSWTVHLTNRAVNHFWRERNGGKDV